jgi:hypothetical protein
MKADDPETFKEKFKLAVEACMDAYEKAEPPKEEAAEPEA